MAPKDQIIMNHYRQVIEARTFDEYDILGFLIFIRPQCEKSKFELIKEFCDLIAHRQRDRGRIMNCIRSAIRSNYECEPNSNKIKGYRGIHWNEWRNEWQRLGSKLQIDISDTVLQEITLCIFSLAQGTSYGDQSYSGTVQLFQSSGGQLSLCTTEGLPHSLFIRFMILDGINGKNRKFDGVIELAVETCRINGVLHLWTGTGDLVI